MRHCISPWVPLRNLTMLKSLTDPVTETHLRVKPSRNACFLVLAPVWYFSVFHRSVCVRERGKKTEVKRDSCRLEPIQIGRKNGFLAQKSGLKPMATPLLQPSNSLAFLQFRPNMKRQRHEANVRRVNATCRLNVNYYIFPVTQCWLSDFFPGSLPQNGLSACATHYVRFTRSPTL